MALTTVYKPDNVKTLLGTGNDLEIYHDGTNSNINNATGSLRIQVDEFRVKSQDNNENIIRGSKDGNVELYYDNVEKFRTNPGGIKVSGNIACDGDNQKLLLGAGDDFQLYHDGSNSYLKNSTGNIAIEAKSGEMSIKCIPDGAVELYHNDGLRLETKSDGVALRGTTNYVEGLLRPWAATNTDLGTDSDRWRNIYVYNDIDVKDDGKLLLGDGDDLQIYHTGSNSYIDNTLTGDLFVRSTQANGDVNIVCSATNGGFIVKDTDNDILINGVAGAAVTLYYDGNTKLETQSTGAKTTGTHIVTNGINVEGGNLSFVDNSKAKFGTGDDLEIYHDAWHSYISHTGTGHLYLYGNGTNNVIIRADSGKESIIAEPDEGVKLYFKHLYNAIIILVLLLED